MAIVGLQRDSSSCVNATAGPNTGNTPQPPALTSAMQKAVTSALAFVPDDSSAWERIQNIRRTHDKQFERWPPHVNLLYPFVDHFNAPAASALSCVLAEAPRFCITFTKLSYFKHGKSCTVWLSPDDAGAKRLKQLQGALEQCFPQCNDLARRSSPGSPSAFQPHLTVGQFRNESQAKSFIQSAAWAPVTIEVDRLSVLSRSQTSPFSAVQTIALSNGDSVVMPSSPVQVADAKLPGTSDSINFYQLQGDHLRLSFETPAEIITGTATPTKGEQHILFVVDNSSSMRGKYSSVTKAVQYMLDETAKSGGRFRDPAFVLYNSTAQLCSGADVIASHPTAATSFEAAFEAIMEYINEQPVSSSISIVFMTDGDDTVSKNLPENKTLFKSYLRACRRSVKLHSLGFGCNHKRDFLQELSKMGNSEGCYRYAEGSATGSEGCSGLEDAFADIFDFLQTSVKACIQVGNQKLEVDGTRVAGEGDDGGERGSFERLKFDLLLSKSVCEIDSAELLKITVRGQTVDLQSAPVNEMFCIRVIEETEIGTQLDLDNAQQQLADINPFRPLKQDRLAVIEARALVQAKLDKYHALFAKIARGLVAAGDKASVAAQLSSLRHDTKFAKARRHRTMDKRAAANADMLLAVERNLTDLHATLDMNAFEMMGTGAGLGAGLTCSLSGDTIKEMMEGSQSDVMVFCLQVHRPEHVIDAPTEMGILGVCAGTYSNAAFTASTKFACSAQGKGSIALALGGFDSASPRKPTIFDAHPHCTATSSGIDSSTDTMGDVGIFRGPDGQYMNAALPLYLNEQHWLRVEVQLKPLLGFFFTLDPLGFQEAQYMGLFMILGEMLATRARSLAAGDGRFTSEWMNWLIDDFAKLCAAVLPKARRYLHRLLASICGPHQTPPVMTAGGSGEIDLLDVFLSGPQGRSKSVVPNLMVLVGWKEARAREETICPTPDFPQTAETFDGMQRSSKTTATASAATSLASESSDTIRFDVAFVEELWRRNLDRYYRHHPPTVVHEILEQLLYGPSKPQMVAPASTSKFANNSRKMEQQFAEYAAFRLDELPKSKMSQARATFGANGERPPSVCDGAESGPVYQPRQLAEYHSHTTWMEVLVQTELRKIEGMNQYLESLFGGRTLGRAGKSDYFGGELRRIMLIQALTYRHKTHMKIGVNSGDYKNTFDYMVAADHIVCKGVARHPQVALSLMQHVHATFEQKRQQNWDASLALKADLRVAQQLIACRDPLALAGRLMAACPTRGGSVFQVFLALLGAVNTGATEGVQSGVPLLEPKVRVILTGKLAVVEGGPEKTVMSRGECWTTCPADVVSRLRSAVGDEAFTSIEICMHGTWGWAYRESDIPNRHGHCNSNPFANMSGRFKGFLR